MHPVLLPTHAVQLLIIIQFVHAKMAMTVIRSQIVVQYRKVSLTQCAKSNEALIILVSAPVVDQNPCDPSPCGPYSQCRETNNKQAICSCLPNYIGVAPNCRPECTSSNECPNNLECVNIRCVPPCDKNPCARNAECRNINHNAICTCAEGFEGDPTVDCRPIVIARKIIATYNKRFWTKRFFISLTATSRTPTSACDPNPCGLNADCREQNGAGKLFQIKFHQLIQFL